MKQLFLLACLALFTSAFINQPPKKFKVPKAFVYVPSGTFTPQTGDPVTIQGFYMMATEVSNLDYKEFLHDLRKTGRTAEYEKAKVRPEGWKIPGAYMEPMEKNYHQHPAYNDYPVVNITQEAAQLYCDWLTQKIQANNPNAHVRVRLPLETEWMYAAQGGKDGMPYPHGYYVRNGKGRFLYNFRPVGDESIHRDRKTGKLTIKKQRGPAASTGSFGPAPAESYVPNDYGLYNMSGNVAEMLADAGRTKGGCFNSTGYDIRIDASDEFSGFTENSPFIGFRPVLTLVGKKK